MATLVISNSGSSSPTDMRVRITYTAASGAFTLTKIEGCRTGSTRSYNLDVKTITVAVGSSSQVLTGTGLDFPANSAYKSIWSGSKAWTTSGTITITITFPSSTVANIKNAKFTNNTINVPPNAPYFTTCTTTSLPATAYANIPYTFNLTLACNYNGFSNGVMKYRSSAGAVDLVSTTGTSVAAGNRTHTFTTSQVGTTYTFRGVISYTNASGTTAWSGQGNDGNHDVTVQYKNASFTTATMTSLPSTAYVNIPYKYNVTLGANYGSSTSNNSLYLETKSTASTPTYITLVSTTGTSIAAGERSYTFTNSAIGTHNFQATISYSNSSGTKTYIHPSLSTTYPLTVSYLNPSWVTYTITSFAATAYVGIPYKYNINLVCKYNSSITNNKLSWSDGTITLTSTTGTEITAGERSYTFTNAQIGSHTFKGIIQYTNSSDTTATLANSTTRALTVSFLNPTLTGVTQALNKTDFFRTSTVTLTSSGTITGNSTAATAYAYFSDTTDATGDGSGAGFYKIGTAAVNTAVAWKSEQKSYTHPGTRTGTFVARLSLRGNNSAGTWTEFTKTSDISYTMHEFVAPTATRTVTYTKNNIYKGQTKLPCKTVITAVSRSQYDTLTPTCAIRPIKGGAYVGSLSYSHNWAVGTYATTFTFPTACATGDQIIFRDILTYKNATNSDATTNANSVTYTVKDIPTPTSTQVKPGISIDTTKGTILGDITGNIDTDFICYYTMYIESSDGNKQYATFTGSLKGTEYVSNTYTYDKSLTEFYRVRVVCYYALVDETSVKGSNGTVTSGIVATFGGAKLCAKSNNTTTKYNLLTSAQCPKPRLAVKNGTTTYYIPLITTGFVKGNLDVKGGTTTYQLKPDYVPK